MPLPGFWCRIIALLALSAVVTARADEVLRIDDYVRLVLRDNPAARAAQAHEDSAAAESTSSRLYPDPVLQLGVGEGRSASDSSVRATETSVAVSQTIPWFPARSAAMEASDQAAAALRAEATATRWGLAVDARLAFYRLLAARALVDVARDAESDARSLLDLVTRRATLGETREVDRIKARVEWLRQQRELRAVEREAEAAESALRTLAVRSLPRPLVLSGDLPGPVGARDPLEETLAERLERSPAVLAARAEAARAAALVSHERASRVPDLDLSLFREKELDREAFGVTVGIVVPLWNGRRGGIARAGAESLLRSAELERIRLKLLTDAEARRRDVDIASAEVATLTSDLLPASSESLGLARLLFEEGETSLLDLLDAQRSARDARREEIRARLELAVAFSELQRLLGPGETVPSPGGGR